MVKSIHRNRGGQIWLSKTYSKELWDEVTAIQRIIRNAVQCNLCGDIIESTYKHDLVTCKCGCCSIDGGLDYLRRSFTCSRDDFTELSILEDTEKSN